MEEIWRDVVGYEGLYEVSSLGRIKSLKTGIILKDQKGRHGYRTVWLYGKKSMPGRTGKNYFVHRIVAMAFCPNPSGFNEVNHKNEIKWDNRADNLEWCSHQYNSSYGERGKKIGEKNTNGKRSTPIDQLDMDGNYIRTFPSWAEMRRSGYHPGCVWKQIHGKYTNAYGFKWRYAEPTSLSQ